MTSSRSAALIVEDQPFVGLVASDILRESGFETFHACDAANGAEVLDAHPEIGVIVIEAALLGSREGAELARRVSHERPNLQLVVTSGESSAPAVGMPEGARFLHKPYASAELKTLVSAGAQLEDA